MKTMTRYLFLSFLIGNFIGIGGHALAQKAAPLSEQEKTAIGTGTSGAPAPTSTTVKKIPAAKIVKKKPAAATATSATAKPSTSIKKTTALPVTPSYTPPATSAPSTAAGVGTAAQVQGYKPPTSPFVKPSYTPPAVSLPSKTIGVDTTVQGQGIKTPSGAYVIPDYDPPRSGPLGSGTPIGQPGSVTATPRSGSVPLFPVSVGTGSGGQEQGVKTPGALVVPSSIGGKGVAPGSEAAPAVSGSAPPAAVDSSERLRLLKEKYGKGSTISGDVQSDDASQKATGASDGKSGAGGAAASEQATGAGGTASGGKAGKTAAAAAIEASAAASAASGIVGAGPKKDSEGKEQSPETTGAGQQGETAAQREKDIRERFNIPDDVPIKSTAEAIGFAAQIEALGGKLTSETWRTWNEKGNEAVIKGTLCENYEIPDCAAVGSSKDIWDVLQNAATVGDGRVTPGMWRDVGKRGKDAVIDGMIEDTFGVSKPGNMSREDLLKGLAEGDRLGVPRQDRPSFIQDWDRQRNGGITLDELLNKWMPGAKPGIDRGGLPGGGLPGGPGSGSSGLPGPPTGPGGLSGGTGPGGIPGLPGIPGGGTSSPGGVQGVLDALRGGAAVGATAGGLGGGVPGGGTSGTGIPGVPGVGSGGSGGQGGALGGGRAAGLLDTLNTGTGIGTAGQAGGGQGQSSSGTSTTTGTGISGSGSGSGGSSSGSGGAGGAAPGVGGSGSQTGAGSGVNGPPGATEWTRFTSDGQGGYYATTYVIDEEGNTVPVTTDHYTSQDNGTWKDDGSGDTLYNQPDTNGSYVYSSTDDGSKKDTLTYVPDAGTQGTGEEEGQSGMYNPDDDSLYRRRGMSAEERAKAMEDFQKLKPVDGGRGGEGGGQRQTGLKMSDVNTMEILKSKTDPYITPNPDADQSEHSGPIPVTDPQGDVEQPVPDSGPTTPGFGRMGGATRPGGSTAPGGFDPNVAGQQ